MSETDTDTTPREPFRSGVYVRTALYVLLVASGVFAALQAHQYFNRKAQVPADTPPAPGRLDTEAGDDPFFIPDVPAGAIGGMVRVAALPPVDSPAGGRLWFALGRPSIEPGHVQLMWLYRGNLTPAEVERHYRASFLSAGYEGRGERDAENRRTLVFTRGSEVAILTLRTQDEDEKIERFIVTLNRPAREGDFAATTQPAN